jgi:hypothetical protein
VLSNVVETIGGRVIQIIGARLDDLTVEGSIGQDHSTPKGESWEQAIQFLNLITDIMEFQSQDVTQQRQMQPPAVFTYPPRGWRFQVYVKALEDADGGNSLVLSTGKFNQRYRLTLFIVQDASGALVKAGTANGVFSQRAYDAVSAFMARISDGVGWAFSQYTGIATGTLPTSPGSTKKTTPGAG